MPSLLQIAHLTKRFGGVIATDGVNFEIAEGEIHALIGPNGAGKTTLLAQISGALKPDGGLIGFDGHDVTDLSMHERAEKGLARSYQITSIFRQFRVLDNVALAVQARSGSSLSFWRPVASEHALFQEAREILAEVGLAGREDRLAGMLAHGEQRQLEVGLALAAHPRLLLLDEPTAGMGPEESERMVELIDGLKGRVSILLVEHDMDAVFRLADRISVMVNGRVIATGEPETVRADPEVKRAYLGEKATNSRTPVLAKVSKEARGPPTGASDILAVDKLETAYGASQVLFGLSFSIREGEVATLLGRNGMGKTTAVRSIMGITPGRDGAIIFRGKRIERLSPDGVARMGVALVPEGRQVFNNLTVREHLVAFAANRSGGHDPWTLEKVFEFFPQLAERAGHLGNQLSGGEQQMLAIGRALMTNPHLLILDEATEGLAPLVREEIWKCLARLREMGQTILIIDKYVERLIALADHHTIIERGRVAWQGNSAQLDADQRLWQRYLGV